MRKYSIINYKLKKTTKPIDVLHELERLMQKYNVLYSECLMKLEVTIIEFEHDGKLHSNRYKNAIYTILKDFPDLNVFLEHKKQEDEDGFIKEALTISNYSKKNLLALGKSDYSLIKKIADKIPRPYSVNDFEIIFNGIGWDTGTDQHRLLKPSSDGSDAPVGNYISYSRSNYGNEKHSYIQFSADDEYLASMRQLFWEFSQNITGKYEGTEYHA